METKNKVKEFDTVKFFRSEKKRISRETAQYSFEELKAYLKNLQDLKRD